MKDFIKRIDYLSLSEYSQNVNCEEDIWIEHDIKLGTEHIHEKTKVMQKKRYLRDNNDYLTIMKREIQKILIKMRYVKSAFNKLIVERVWKWEMAEELNKDTSATHNQRTKGPKQ